MKIEGLTSITIGFFLLSFSTLMTAQNEGHSFIALKSCEIEISADQVFYHQDSISYSGNVQFLYGLANVKADRVVLIKKKDGTCHIIAKPIHAKGLR